MGPRKLILGTALAFIAVFAALTLYVTIRNGPDILTVFSVLILGMLGFGVLGALRGPPEQ
ncbi:MAG TPA: hypothetical protein VGN69_07400 [Solirubrobacteraceae bacterium]|jgi:hypothetical protein|nr:hypothetical protein [Solirubrobacteraceae bacterium]